MRIERGAWALIVDATSECGRNKVLRLAAALAYYAMFSLAPLLIIVTLIVGRAFGDELAEREVTAQIETVIGPIGAQALHMLLGSARTWTSDPATATIGVVGLLVAASVLFHHLKDSLNTIWNVAPVPGRGLGRFLRNRLLAMLMVLVLGVLALLGLLMSIGLGWSTTRLSTSLPFDVSIALIRGAQFAVAVAVVTLLVALTYRLLPDTHIAWRDGLVGALSTALLLVASQVVIGVYLRSGAVGSAYSAIGVIVLVLVWVYYSALVFFFGAELTWVYANRYGARIVPSEQAAVLSPESQAAQGIVPASEG